MYSPPYNRLADRAELIAFLRANNFPLLVTGLGGSLHASHLPAMIHEDGERMVIDMHMAHANQQWREFFDEEVLVIFSGPHAYVSPRWYEDVEDRKSTRLNSSHMSISYAVFCLKKKK